MSTNSKAIAKLKKQSSKFPWEYGLNGLKSWVLQRLPPFFVLWLLSKILNMSEYLLKRESIKFIRFWSEAYGESNHSRCRRMLRIWINLIDRRIPKHYINLLSDAARSTLKDPKTRAQLSDTVLEATRQLDVSLLDATSWYQLSRGLFSNGYCRAAWVARERSIELSILDSAATGADDTDMLRGIQAHLERNEIRELNYRLIESHNQLSNSNIRLIKDGVSLQTGDCRRDSNSTNADLFRGLVTDLTVGIIGPGVSDVDYGSELDSFDTLVRVKFIGRKLLDDEFFGSKTDISFISAIDAVNALPSYLQPAIGEVKLILTVSSAVKEINSIPVYESGFESYLYRTTPVSGLHVLLAVLRAAPKKLKLFGFDFFTRPTLYSKKFIEFYEDSSWMFGTMNKLFKDGVVLKHEYAATFALHDQVSNFCFAQNLYKAGLFDIEPYGKSILELTPYQYVERLEEMLGDW